MEMPWAFASEWLLVAALGYCLLHGVRAPAGAKANLALTNAGLVLALLFITGNAIVGALRYLGLPSLFGWSAEQILALHQAMTLSSKLIAMPLYAVAVSYRAGALRAPHSLLLLFFALAPAWLPVSKLFTDASIVVALLVLCLHSRWQQFTVLALLALLAIPFSGLLRLGSEASIALMHVLLALHFVAIGRFFCGKKPSELTFSQ